MTCQSVRELFPDLLPPRATAESDRELPPALAAARAHLRDCPDCRREFSSLTELGAALDQIIVPAPSAKLRRNFAAMLAEEKQRLAGKQRSVAGHGAVPSPMQAGRPRARGIWRWILAPLAACALVAAGFFAGRSVPAPATASPAAVVANDTTQRELTALREQMDQQRQQLDRMTTLVSYSILQQQQNPAIDRLRDVLAAARAEHVNDKVLDDLIQALTLDPSANVRLRALEALLPHAERATVRAGVLAALPREQNPLVQLELIDFVATTQETDAAPILEKIFADESANRTVRQAAQLALAQF